MVRNTQEALEGVRDRESGRIRVPWTRAESASEDYSANCARWSLAKAPSAARSSAYEPLSTIAPS